MNKLKTLHFHLSMFFVLTIFFSHPAAFAETQNEKAINEAVQQELPKAIEAEAKKKDVADNQAILNKNFGAGIIANFDFASGGARVKSASVVGGVVRVGETSKSQVGFMLEAHKFTSDPSTNTSKAFFGPFIGLVLQEANIDTAVLGVMWGIKQPKSEQTLNIGMGLSVSPHAQVLGDGIIEGAALPNGETEVRFKRITKYGFAITTSFGF